MPSGDGFDGFREPEKKPERPKNADVLNVVSDMRYVQEFESEMESYVSALFMGLFQLMGCRGTCFSAEWCIKELN